MPDNSFKEKYEVIFSIQGKEFQSEGDTLLDALKSLKSEFYKTKGILTVKNGELKAEKLLPARLVMRLFGPFGSFTKDILMQRTAKQFEQLLK